MRLIVGIIICALAVGSSAGPYNPLTEIRKGVEKGIDITKQAANFTPGIDDIAKVGKDLIFGAPIKVILEGINKVCSLALATEGDVERSDEVIPELGEVSIKFMDDKYNKSFNVASIGEMVKLDTFNRDYPTVILTTGWLSIRENKTNVSAEKILRAYRCRGNVNFILFDSGDYIATIYTWSARNTESLGKFLGEFLVKLSDHIDMEKLHLIGHSLGAQISGEAGRQYQEKTDKLLPRITALDPARPCFNEGEVLNGVGRGDAAYVDVIHTNNGALGQRIPLGDADFYPNGVTILQPGSFDIGSSHTRAVDLYAESVLPGNENTFSATKCNSLYSLNSGLCTRGKASMGYAARKDDKGNFFLKTDSKSPYGEAKINACGGLNISEDESKTTTTTTTEATTSDNAEKSNGSSSTSSVSDSQGTSTEPSTTTTTTTKKSKILGVFG